MAIFLRVVLLVGLGAPVLPAQERTYSFSTLAGTASAGHVDGDSETARFSQPADVAVDAAGNLYVADSGNHAVRKITPAGITTTVAGQPFASVAVDGPANVATFRAASGIKVDASGNLFIADSWSIRRIGTDGQVTTFAGYTGDGYPSPLKADGVGTSARFNGILGIGLSPGGLLYVGDGDNYIRQITPSGVVTTLAGQGVPGQSDGQGAAAGFYGPSGIYVDAGGIIWITDSFNNTIRRMTPDGQVSTFAGKKGVSGATDGVGLAATFNLPAGITGDAAGNLYVSEDGSEGIRRIDSSGQTTAMAGKFGPNMSSGQGSDDGVGPQASFRQPRGLATDSAGNVYIADQQNNLIRKMTPTGTVTTVAGYSPEEAAGFRDARAGDARFRFPLGIAVTADGVAYVADSGNHVIRRIDADGVVSTFAGKPGESGYANGTATEARFASPHSIALWKDGSLYVADANNAVRRISPDGTVTALAGSNQANRQLYDATGAAASFSRTGPLTVGPDGSVYVVDAYITSYGAARTALRRITPAGEVSTVVNEFWPHSEIGGLAVAPDGTLYATDAADNMLFKFKAGTLDTLPLKPSSEAFSPSGIAIDQQGNIFVTEGPDIYGSGSRVAQVAPDGTISTLGGVRFLVGWQDGVGTKTLFDQTQGIAVDSHGSLYIACSSNVIRKGMLVGAPAITTQPQGATVATGGSVQLSVAATGTPAPSYQWFFNGNAIAGANAPSYSIANANAATVGNYSVTVSNSLGSVTSSIAVVALSTTPPAGPGNGGGSSGSGGGSGSGSGGGGGAPSLWFMGILSALGVVRRFFRVPRG